MLRGWRVSRPVSAFVRGKSTWKGVKLSNRSVIRLSGEESRDFIQGLITNDIHHLGGTVSSVYTLFLNKAGRVLYDAVIYGTENRGELFVETDGAVAKDLRKHMMIYRIRRKIAIDLVDDEFAVWAAFGGDEKEPLEITNSRPDPRLKDLGFRILCRGDKEVKNHLEVTNLSQYNKHRYQLGIPEGVKEIIPGKAFPLEVNCDYMNGLSVHKGCYLGQEFTARTYHTGVIRKRIMPIELEEPPPPGEDLIEKDVLLADEKSGGKVKGIEDKSGIGLLRIEKVLASDTLRVNKSISLRTWKPSWWPEKTS